MIRSSVFFRRFGGVDLGWVGNVSMFFLEGLRIHRSVSETHETPGDSTRIYCSSDCFTKTLHDILFCLEDDMMRTRIRFFHVTTAQ